MIPVRPAPPSPWLVSTRSHCGVVWCGSGLELLGPRCGVVRGIRLLDGVGVMILTFIIMIIIYTVPFLSQLSPVRNAILAALTFLIPSCRSRGWKVSTVTRIECVWNEILVTVDGFGAAMWGEARTVTGIGTFGPGHVGGRRGSANPEPLITHGDIFHLIT